MIETIGFLAGTLTTLAFVPQTIKSWRTRSVNDLSLAMLIAFNSGIVLWMVYGVLIGSTPILVANTATIVQSLTLLALKLRSGGGSSRP